MNDRNCGGRRTPIRTHQPRHDASCTRPHTQKRQGTSATVLTMSTHISANPRRQMVDGTADGIYGQRARRTRRAPLACQHCRRRKVRCNLAIEGPPCVNCRLDGWTCVLPPRKLPRCLAQKRKGDDDRSPETRGDDCPQDPKDAKEQKEDHNAACMKPAQRQIQNSGIA